MNQVENTGLMERKTTSLLEPFNQAMYALDDVVLKNYVTRLEELPLVPFDEAFYDERFRKDVRFFKITELVVDKEQFAAHKFATVFHTLSYLESKIFLILDSDGRKTEFYMGVRADDDKRSSSSINNVLVNALKGQFPGVKIENDLSATKMKNVVRGFSTTCVSSVSCVPNYRQDDVNKDENFVQGLEKFVEAMKGEKYTGIILADTVSQAQLNETRRLYEDIYSDLSTMAKAQVSYSGSATFSESHTEGSSKSSAETETKTTSKSTSTTEGTSSSVTRNNASSQAVQVLGTARGLVGLVAKKRFMARRSIVESVPEQMFLGSTSETENKSKTNQMGESISQGHTTTETTNKSDTTGKTIGETETRTFTRENKSVEDIMKRIDKQLERIEECESLGMFEVAAYFMADTQHASESAAATYKALVSGKNTGLEVAAINTFGKNTVSRPEEVGKYVTNFVHPTFRYQGGGVDGYVTPCSLVSGKELAVGMGLPRKSVNGFPVIEHASFAKEIITYDGTESRDNIALGKIFDMGSTTEEAVNLDVQSLSMHTFITGSTGSGKSNTVYTILDKLQQKGIGYLVIEPAKGEYKNVFGTNSCVNVLGTNPSKTKLLRINPFKFPEGVHVLEHVDRLIDIFNVCWPMYAAMPAMLKDAVLEAYESCGWDLIESENPYSKKLFPTFKDLLRSLDRIIESSNFSDEVKSNYSGSLITRVKSLANGLNGQIFSSDEVDNEILFDSKTIVDLSLVGSTETRSLIMGILIMRLNEHRMANTTSMNQKMHHVTVLEEAHNILKAQTVGNTGEGSNMAGKSVEMITSSIAEMRTYGEGFIIVDQSPTSVDISAIKNTNTKIIMRLPSDEDRQLAGKSAALTEEQIDEIPKLPRGVAAVYQNNFVEAALCAVNEFVGSEKIYEKPGKDDFIRESLKREILLDYLMRKVYGGNFELNMAELEALIVATDLSCESKILALRLIKQNGRVEIKDMGALLAEMVFEGQAVKQSDQASTIEKWRNCLVEFSSCGLKKLPEDRQNEVISAVISELSRREVLQEGFQEVWQNYLAGGELK